MGVLKFSNIYKETKHYSFKALNYQCKDACINMILCPEAKARMMMIDLISGAIASDQGQVIYKNNPVEKGDYKHLLELSLVSEKVFFYDNLTGIENIELVLASYKKYHTRASYKAMFAHIDGYFKLLNLSNFKHVSVKKYSTIAIGKLKLIRSLVTLPKCLILDEAFIDFDTTTLQVVLQHLKDQCKINGLTVLILSSSFEPVGRFADEISYLHQSRIVKSISSKALLKKQRSYLIVVSKELPKLLLYLEKDLAIFDYEVVSDDEVFLYEGILQADEILKLCALRNISVLKLKYGHDPLENYFLDQLGDKL